MRASTRPARRVAANLGANVLQGVLGFALIPLVTRVLGPSDYGVYGMAMVVLGLVAALCETGLASVLYGHYPDATPTEQRELISSLLTVALVTGLLGGLGLWLVWPLVAHFDALLADLTATERVLIALAVMLRPLWSLTNPILVVQSRSTRLAICLALQAVGSFAFTLIALDVFDQGRASLFWGSTLGFAVGAGAAIAFSLTCGLAKPRRRWMRHVVRVAPGVWLSGLADNVRATLESNAIARAAGSSSLGNYNHARLYQAMLMQGTNALATVAWPVALREAKESPPRFVRIMPAWNFIYVGITVAGLFFVFFGDALVSLVTHGKFDEAAAWLPFLMIYLLLQNSGKGAMAVLYARQRINSLSAIRIGTTLTAAAVLLASIPRFGVPAALAVALAEMFVFRLFVQRAARRDDAVPFQDGWVVAGSGFIFAAWVMNHWIEGLAERVAAFATLAATIAFVARGVAVSLVRQLRGHAP